MVNEQKEKAPLRWVGGQGNGRCCNVCSRLGRTLSCGEVSALGCQTNACTEQQNPNQLSVSAGSLKVEKGVGKGRDRAGERKGREGRE